MLKSLLIIFLKETLIKRICDKVFSRFPDFVQKSKDAAFETLSDPKYSGKMKVSFLFSGDTHKRIYKKHYQMGAWNIVQ